MQQEAEQTKPRHRADLVVSGLWANIIMRPIIVYRPHGHVYLARVMMLMSLKVWVVAS